MTKFKEYHIRQMAENLHKWQAFQNLVESYLPSEYDLESVQDTLDAKDKEIKELKETLQHHEGVEA